MKVYSDCKAVRMLECVFRALSNLEPRLSPALCQRFVAGGNSGITEFLWIFFEYFDWLFAEQEPIKKFKKVIKEIPLCQSLSRRPTADKKAWRLRSRLGPFRLKSIWIKRENYVWDWKEVLALWGLSALRNPWFVRHTFPRHTSISQGQNEWKTREKKRLFCSLKHVCHFLFLQFKIEIMPYQINILFGL